MATEKKKTSSLDSTHPVLVPHRPELFYTSEKFLEWALQELSTDAEAKGEQQQDKADATTQEAKPAPTEASWDMVSKSGGGDDVDMKDDTPAAEKNPPTPTPDTKKIDPKLASPFVAALLGALPPPTPAGIAPDNITLTTNGLPTYASTLTPTLDLFNDLQSDISPAKLDDLLTQSWSYDPLETLKIIFQCRSIHLGKGERDNFYKCVGWLAKSAGARGRATVLANLEWVVQRTIMKPKPRTVPKEVELVKVSEEEQKEKEEERKAEEEEDKKAEEEENDPVYSHGYWKDLGNILALEVADALTIFANVHDVLNPPPKNPKPHKKLKQSAMFKVQAEKNRAAKALLGAEEKLKLAKATRHALEASRHERFLNKFRNEKFYMLLHLATARAFAAQLHADLEALTSGDAQRQKKITLAAKWAPSLEAYHDKHTFLASSIAEILFPPEHALCADHFSDREGYLKLAREHYRRVYLSPLRAHLRVVERDISAQTFTRINYNRVPSLAMARYKKLFNAKDPTRFAAFLLAVASGKASVSGAVLTPASLVLRARNLANTKDAMGTVERQILDGQWNSLVASVKARGTLPSALAVVDVSGSMCYGGKTNDGTCPLDSAIGLGMLLAEVAEEPFKNLMITFDAQPAIVRVDGVGEAAEEGETEPEKWDFWRRVNHVSHLPWGMSTNFLAVFSSLLLPLAVRHALAPADMVKKIFVFSDMQFDAATATADPQSWETGYARVKRMYEEAGYEVPQLVFWNLESSGAVGRVAEGGMEGVVMMAGGGAGTLKAFLADLEGGGEEEEEEEEEEGEGADWGAGMGEGEEGEDWGLVEMDEGEEDAGERKRKSGEDEGQEGKKGKKRKQLDPATAMRRLLANEAYKGLRVVG